MRNIIRPLNEEVPSILRGRKHPVGEAPSGVVVEVMNESNRRFCMTLSLCTDCVKAIAHCRRVKRYAKCGSVREGSRTCITWPLVYDTQHHVHRSDLYGGGIRLTNEISGLQARFTRSGSRTIRVTFTAAQHSFKYRGNPTAPSVQPCKLHNAAFALVSPKTRNREEKPSLYSFSPCGERDYSL